jgi:hypothetical protein
MTCLPAAYRRSITYAQAHPEDLVCWLYRHQSQESRHHLGYRFFTLFHNAVAPRRT